MSTIEQAGGRRGPAAAGSVAGPKAPDVVLVIGFIGLASVLPLIVATWWYDYYYWPKVQALYAVLLLLALVALWTDHARWLRTLRTPAGIALGAWLAVAAVSTIASVNPLLSLVGEDYRYEGLLTWVAYGAIAAGVAGTFVTAGRVRLLLVATFAASGVMAMLGLLQHSGWNPVPEDALRTGWVRAWGTTGSPLALGAYLVLLLPVMISLYAGGTTVTWRRCALGGLVVLLYAALVATSSRAAWGGLAVGMAVWAFASSRERLSRATRPLLFLGVACAAATLAVTRTSPPVMGSHATSPQSAEQRMVLWTTVAPLVMKRPYLGWGLETLAEIYPAYGSPAFLRAFPEAAMQRIYVDRPHNDLLQQAVSTGLVGLAAYLWMWIALFQMAWKVAHSFRSGDSVAVLAAGLLGGFAAYFVQLQFSFSYVSVAPVFWSLVGVMLVLAKGPSTPAYLSAPE